MNKIFTSKGIDFIDELGCMQNTDVRFSLVEVNEKDKFYNLDINIDQRTNTGFDLNVSIYGITEKGVDTLISRLEEVKYKLKEIENN